MVLAGAERNEALLDLALGYLTVVLMTATFGTATRSRGFPVQLVTAGSVLLFGGILTKAGQAALEDEIAQLKLLISRIEPAPSL